jgi:hypothetical protein
LAVASLLLWCGFALAQPARIGQVAALQGQATVKRAGSPQASPLSLQQPVFQEDVIETAAASKIKLLLVDGTELSLGAQGTMTLSKLVYAPQQQKHQGVVGIAQGIFRAVTPRLIPQTNFEVHTATAVAAVRGTQWLGEVTPDATGIVVLQGAVAVVHANARIRGEAVLQVGEGTDVVGQQPPTAPKPWKQERISKLVQATELR